LRAHVDALFVRARILSREAFDQGEERGCVMVGTSSAREKTERKKRKIGSATMIRIKGLRQGKVGFRREDAPIRAIDGFRRGDSGPESRSTFVEAELFPQLEALLRAESASLD
jgi:hypothetical protein